MAKKKSAPAPAPPASSPWIGIALGYFALVVVLVSVLVPRSFWGLASPHYFSIATGIAALVLAGLSFFPASDRYLERVLSAKKFPWLAALFCTAFVALAWFNRIQLNWLGDQTLWIRDVDKYDLFHPIEPLSYKLVELSHNGFSPIAGKHGEHLLSVLLGGLFFFLAWRLSKELIPKNPTRQTLFWVCACSVPQLLFYFGYVESYPYLLLALMVVAWTTFRVLRGGTVLATWLSVLLATSMHLFGIGSVAAVAFAAWTRKKRMVAILTVIIGLALIVGWLMRVNVRAAYFVNDPRTTLTLFDLSRGGWHKFLGWGHLRGMLNILLLTGGPVLCLLPFIPWREAWHSDRKRVLVWGLLIAPAIGGLLFLRMLLGAPRDWDLFAAYLYFIPLLILWVWLKFTPGRTLPRFSAALLTLSLLHAAFWVSVNLDWDRGMEQARMLYGTASIQSRKPIAKAAEEVGILEREAGNLESSLAWIQVCIDKVPSHWRYYNLYAHTAFRMGDVALSEEYYWKAVDLKPKKNTPYLDLGKIYLAEQDGENALKIFRRAQQDRGPHPEWSLGVGTALTFLGDYPAAIACLDSSLTLFPKYTLALLQRGATKYYSGDLGGGIRDLQQGLRFHPDQADGWRILQEAAGKAGFEDLAESAGQKLIDLKILRTKTTSP